MDNNAAEYETMAIIELEKSDDGSTFDINHRGAASTLTLERHIQRAQVYATLALAAATETAARRTASTIR